MKEELNITNAQLKAIQKSFKSDIRSMINYIQANHKQFSESTEYTHITNDLWEKLIEKIKTEEEGVVIDYIYTISAKYNVDKVDLLHEFINYLIKTKDYALKEEWISKFRFIIHSEITNANYLIPYSVYNLKSLFSVS